VYYSNLQNSKELTAQDSEQEAPTRRGTCGDAVDDELCRVEWKCAIDPAEPEQAATGPASTQAAAACSCAALCAVALPFVGPAAWITLARKASRAAARGPTKYKSSAIECISHQQPPAGYEWDPANELCEQYSPR
jgi:hypothetical protein